MIKIHFKSQKKDIKFFKMLFISTILLGCLSTGILYGYVSFLVKDEPVRSNDEILKMIRDNDITGYVYFNDRTLAGLLQTGENRQMMTTEEIPDQVIHAFLSIEDNQFYSHLGIDIKGTSRAVMQKIFNKEVQTGGSTITQQLVRRVFLNMGRTYERKAAEILLAMRVDDILSKDEILLAYLTKIYFGKGSDGSNLYGIKAAAEGIFGVSKLYHLDLAQTAYLAGLPQLPSKYSAFGPNGAFNQLSFAGAIKRQQLVLKRMYEEKKITLEQYENAKDFDIKGSLAETVPKLNSNYPFLIMEVEQRAAALLFKQKYPHVEINDPNYLEEREELQKELVTKGYKIYTTIDPTIYKEMQYIAENKQNFTEDHSVKGIEQVGAMMIDNKTGAILGMIEGRDFHIEQLNHATQMVRQPGSAMKPIAAYLPALDRGLIQPASIIDDVPVLLEDSGNGIHIPENWDHTFHGLTTAREALKWSYNIPALKLFNETLGLEEAWAFAKKLGITSITEEDHHAKTGVIGGLTYGVSVEELSNAYAAIGNEGVYNDAFLIAKIENALGEVVYEHRSKPVNVFTEQTAYLMTDMMKTVVDSGTAADLKKDFNHFEKISFAGKTGSTQDDADAWFIGYTPDVTVGVWAGYDQPIHKLSKTNCSETAGCGTSRAKKIWAKIMDSTLENRGDLFPSKEFVKPDRIVEMTVSKFSAKLPTQELIDRGDIVKDIFNKQYIPEETDDIAGMTRYVIYNQSKYLAQTETPEDMVYNSFQVKREKSVSEILNEIQSVQAQIPQSERKPISHYIPIDAEWVDGPAESDPRNDDGQAPSPPKGLTINNINNSYEISFQMNSESDVAGYRLYRSVEGRSFQYAAGKPVSSQEEAYFQINKPKRSHYVYVITAVDVAGKESEPSDVIFSNKKAVEDWFSDFFRNRE
jgi:penicillin-binding protein